MYPVVVPLGASLERGDPLVVVGVASHRVIDNLVEVFAHLTVGQRDRRVLVHKTVDRQQRAVSGCRKNFEKATLLARVDDLVNRNLTLLDSEIKSLLNVILHIDYGLTRHSVHNASVLRRRNQLQIAVARLLEDEHVQNGALLNVIV